MLVSKLKAFLDRHGVRYTVLSHSPAYTAQEIAGAAHVHGCEMAKTVMVKLDGRLAMIVMPATQKVRFDMLRAATGAGQVELAGERDFARSFPECEVGAMPPFGNLWGVPVYVSDRLAQDERIAFNAGTHTELVRMSYADFARLARPTVLHMALWSSTQALPVPA
jgi:Ala-tRNA(Pro) deacylase